MRIGEVIEGAQRVESIAARQEQRHNNPPNELRELSIEGAKGGAWSSRQNTAPGAPVGTNTIDQ